MNEESLGTVIYRNITLDLETFCEANNIRTEIFERIYQLSQVFRTLLVLSL